MLLITLVFFFSLITKQNKIDKNEILIETSKHHLNHLFDEN